ncbi:branched-chain amino acid ABC transporter ATP-binding protein/permease [Nocardioides sp. BYT-33-1]|uniref:branched-chain amino acid ABC transporter ATP-binding protein/permease n=1 Tax=Nocardioides sp. BYT-33-1 TaxID=3416952 RepID=UPI003F52DBF7
MLTDIRDSLAGTTRRALDRVPLPVRRIAAFPPAHGLVVVAVAAALLSSWGPLSYNGYVLQLIAVYVVATLGLNVMTGFAGVLSLGQGAAFAIGAYVTGMLAGTQGWAFWVALPIALVAGIAVGIVVGAPAGRLGELGLAMVSLGAVLVVNDMIVTFRSATGGNDGIAGITARWGFDLDDPGSPTTTAILILLVAYLAYCLHAFYRRSRLGRATAAVRDEPIGASALGVQGYVAKVLAFALGSGLGALSGGLFAYLSAYIAPDAFSPNLSILFLVMVVLGGAGSIIGPVVGTVILVLVPLQLDEYPHVNVLVYGALLVVLTRVRPRGIVSRTASAAPGATKALLASPSVEIPERSRGDVVLEVRDLARSFGGVRALGGIDLDVRRGEVLGLVGPNGSGKTTALNVICGHYAPTAGTVTWRGRSIGGLRPAEIARLGVARTFQTPKTFDGMSVEEHLAIAPASTDPELELACRQAARELLRLGGLDPSDPRAMSRESRTMSHGQLRFLEAATAVSACPGLLLLDEPAAGLSASEIAGFEAVVGDLAAAGVAVVIVEHHLDLISRLSDRIVVLDLGTVLWQGDPDGLHDDAAVRAAYLGVS